VSDASELTSAREKTQKGYENLAEFTNENLIKYYEHKEMEKGEEVGDEVSDKEEKPESVKEEEEEDTLNEPTGDFEQSGFMESVEVEKV